MASVLFKIGGVVVNTLAFGSTNLAFSMLTDHDAKERQIHDLAEERLQKARNKWNRDRMKCLEYINRRLLKKMRQVHTLTMLMKQCLNTLEYFQNK